MLGNILRDLKKKLKRDVPENCHDGQEHFSRGHGRLTALVRSRGCEHVLADHHTLV